jgi:hypothetical protein
MTPDNMFARLKRYFRQRQLPPPPLEIEEACADFFYSAEGIEDREDRMADEPGGKIVRLPDEIFIKYGNRHLSLVGLRK